MTCGSNLNRESIGSTVCLDNQHTLSSLSSVDDECHEKSSDSDSSMENFPDGSRFVKLLQRLRKRKSNSNISLPVVVSEAEILLAILNLCNKNHLSNSAIADSYKMLNTFFGYKLFPSSRYLVDQLFNCN